MTSVNRLLALTLAAGLVACDEPTRPAMIRQLPEQPRLTVVVSSATDLGTLGGTFSAALAVNALGQIVGNSTVAGDATQHGFLSQSGTGMTDLGTLGGTSSQVASNDGFGARAINASGQVVGWSSVAGDASQHAFLWQSGTGMTDLGTLGGTFSYAFAVNAVGQVAGYSTTVGSAGGTRHAFLWQNGTGMTDLGTLGGTFSTALAVNPFGQVVGYSATAGGPAHAFLWQSGTGMTDLGTLGGSFSAAVAVNALGQVVGWSYPAGNANLHAFLWQSGRGITDLGTLGGTYSVAVAVNALGEVVGNSTTAGDAAFHAFLWQSGTGMTDLGTLGGNFSSALAVNDQGQIVGQSQTAGGQTHAALWNTLLPPTPAEQVAALTNAVTGLGTAGTLNKGQTQALLAKLDVISRLLNNGNKIAAANLLQAFINDVRALVNAGLVSASGGQILIDAAQNLINQLKT